MNNNRTSLEWTTEMKIVLVTLDQEERAKGRGFMKRVKDRWDAKYPEYQSASWQKLRDNAARFKKDPELKDIMLVRQREQIQRGEIVIENNEAEERNIDEPGMRNDEDEQTLRSRKEQRKSYVRIYQVRTPYLKLPISYIQWEKRLDMQRV